MSSNKILFLKILPSLKVSSVSLAQTTHNSVSTQLFKQESSFVSPLVAPNFGVLPPKPFHHPLPHWS